MKIARVEQKRTRLQQSLLLVIMTLVAMMMFLSHGPATSYWIDILAIVCLAVCLYVLVTERKLKNREASLLDELVRKDRVVDHLGSELVAGHFELEENKEKAEELEDRLKEIAKVYRAINQVNAASSSDGVSRTALRAALELVCGDRGSIMLLDEDKRYLRVETTIGFEKSGTPSTRQKIGEGMAGSVAEFGEPVRISGESQCDELFQTFSKLTGEIRSALCVPLKLKDETIGVMNLGLAGPGSSEFDDHHMSLATIFGEHASVAIMYSQLSRSLVNEC